MESYLNEKKNASPIVLLRNVFVHNFRDHNELTSYYLSSIVIEPDDSLIPAESKGLKDLIQNQKSSLGLIGCIKDVKPHVSHLREINPTEEKPTNSTCRCLVVGFSGLTVYKACVMSKCNHSKLLLQSDSEYKCRICNLSFKNDQFLKRFYCWV